MCPASDLSVFWNCVWSPTVLLEYHTVLQDIGHDSLLHFFFFAYYWGYAVWPVQIQIKTSASCMTFHRPKKKKNLDGLYQYGTILERKVCPDLDSHPSPQFSGSPRFHYS
jgi:hypothetical protein